MKRALRTAMRLVEAVYGEPQIPDTNMYLAASIQQMNFAEDKLIALMLKARPGGSDGNGGKSEEGYGPISARQWPQP